MSLSGLDVGQCSGASPSRASARPCSAASRSGWRGWSAAARAAGTATTETAIVWSGDFSTEFRDHTLDLGPGQCCVVPVGAAQRGRSREGAEVILFTSAG